MADEDQSSVSKAGDAVDKHVDKLADSLGKKTGNLPALPSDQRKGIAKVYPWLAAGAALVGLVWAKDFWDAARALDNVEEALGEFGSLFAAAVETQYNSFFLYVTVVLLALAAVFVGMAFAKGAMQVSRAAWSWLFKAALTGVLAAVSMLVAVEFDFGFGKFWLTLLASLAGVYLLLQTKSEFSK